MKKSIFVLGLIGGIIGIISNALLLFTGLNMKVTERSVDSIIITSIIGIIFSIGSLVAACIVEKAKFISTGLMFLAAIINILTTLNSLSADNPLTFILCSITATILIVSGIMSLFVKWFYSNVKRPED